MIYFLLTLDADEADFLSQLYETYKKPMWHYAVHFVKDAPAADDIVNSAFVRLIGRIELLQSLKGKPLEAYISVTVKHTAFAYLRQKGDDSISLEEVAIEDAQASTEYLKKIDYAHVWEAVDKLPDRQKDVLLLRYVTDKNYKDIGEIMGTTEVNARTISHRAVKKLRSILGVTE